MTDEDAWRMEERFWTGGEDHRREVLDPACVMAFPPSARLCAFWGGELGRAGPMAT
jgi:hypothetical protein